MNAVNLDGTFQMSKAVWPILIARVLRRLEALVSRSMPLRRWSSPA